MALFDPVTSPPTDSRPTGYMPYIMTSVAIIAVVFLFFGDTLINLRPFIWDAPTNTPVPTPAATK